MKQKLLVVAIASLSGAAFAQSNVTISGVLQVPVRIRPSSRST